MMLYLQLFNMKVTDKFQSVISEMFLSGNFRQILALDYFAFIQLGIIFIINLAKEIRD